MKKLLHLAIPFVLLLGVNLSLSSQNSSILFCEDFNTLPWQMTTSGDPSAVAPVFTPDSNVYRGGMKYSATDTVGRHYDGIPIRSYLTSPVIYGIDTPSFVSVNFYHIAYIETADRVFVEVTFDNGNTWIRLNQNYYEGSSVLLSGGGFSKLSRPFLWKFIPNNDTNFVWNNSNAAWIQEEFNLQPLIDANNADSMQVRIVLEDSPSSFPGRVGEHRYYLEDFCIFGSDCPPGDPVVDVNEPDNYPNQYIGNVYLEGPYRFNVNATSPSTIDSVYVEYIVKRDTNNDFSFEVVHDSAIHLPFAGGTSYEGEIPASMTELGDSVYWRVKAIDASPCANITYDPNQGYNEFEVRGNLPISCNTTPISSLPYVETFDNWIMTSNLGNMQNDWQNVEGDFHDWWLWEGETPTPQTGPKDDYPGGGQYLYVETTGYYDSTAFLLTPCIDFTEIQNAKVRFYLHQLTDGTDTVWVDVFNTTPQPGFPYGRYDENIVPPIPGNKGDRWLPVEFTTYQYRGKVSQIRIRVKPSKTSEQSDVALDSFSIVTAPLVDLRAERVVIGPYLPEGEQTSVVVNVQNQGVFPTDSTILFNYDIIMENTGQIHDSGRDIPWNGIIAPGEDSAISLDSKQFNAPLGQYTIKAWIEYPGDEVPGNDTTQQRSYGLAYKNGSFYFETFDEPGRDIIFTAVGDPDTLTNFWELGTPSYDRTDGAFSTQSYNSPYAEFNCWDILLDRPYIGDGNTVQLVTPFLDFSNTQNPMLSFFNNRDIDTTKAGVYIEYSLDRGFTWDSVPGFADLNRKRWYNSYLAAGGFGGQPVFAGITRHMPGSWNGWVESELKLPSNIFAGVKYVLLRFMFFAEDFQDVTSGFNSNDGMSIDNFHVYDEMPTDIEVQHILRPFNECDLDSIERFKTVFKNRGQNDVNTFDVEYIVKHIPTGNTVSKSETVSKTIAPRDTGIVKSTVDFDMRALGDYEVKVIVSMQNDAYSQNDTAIKYVENIDGCWMVFEAITAAFERPATQDSSYWRFEYTSGGREYYITDHYESFNEFDTNRVDVCFRKNADVIFDLGDVDTAIVDYSLYGYDREVDTMIVQQQAGGPESPIQEFHWVCPPERSAKTIAIIIDNEDVQPPIAKEYLFEMEFLNNGLDSIREIYLGMSVDGIKLKPDTLTIFNNPVIDYNRKSGRVGFGFYHLSPGRHEVKAWTHDPNFKQDELPEDDTLTRYFTVLDTFLLDGDGTIMDTNGTVRPVADGEFCTDFEFDNEADSISWLVAKFPNWYQRGTTFELGTPSTSNLNGARSGNNAMVTNASSDYINFDSSAVYSPFIRLRKDSCYMLSFHHNYYFEGEFNDGAQVLLSLDTGSTWENLNQRVVDVGDTLLQQGWYNTRHIIAIEDNNNNAGWSGQSNGWVYAQTYIPSYVDAYAKFAFRFASDGNYVADGWAFDDFCLKPISPANCFAVGLGERELDEDQLYLGQSVPNPAVTDVEIPYYLPKSGNVYFEVTNMMGQKVREMNITKSHGNHLMRLDVSDLGSGVYYYWIIFDGQKLSKKMIITK